MMPASLVRSDNLTLVVDSWPVMEWLKKRQPTTNRFITILALAQAGEVTLLLSSINLGEIYYNCWNEWGKDRAEEVLLRLRKPPISIIHPNQEDVLAAARVKAQYKVSYADAFVAVLAIEFGARVLSGDDDFIKLQRTGLIDLEWLGA